MRGCSNLPQIRWQYRVHEQILPSVVSAGGKQRWSNVVVEHTGYSNAAQVHHKNEYYLKLGELQNSEHPNDPVTLFNLGLCYFRADRAAEALPLLRQSLERSRTNDPFSYAQKAYL